ncbi:hypothetical protein PIROE2DRAFT_12555 [Piromyces sp. E2]|nr:hypothetical protein PIROE2DRAFT_12555 [Piromyces sp. E2]|eukprot:OUM61454.1 hypothetical protein PIROE2DRAFT_12555 [Piromyces sp. E2]
MNTNLILSIMGIIGGLIMCISDILLDLKGKNNKEINNINSNWKKMSVWRFHLSIILSTIGVPMAGLGLFSLGYQVAENIFVHSVLCFAPCIYKSVQDKKSAEQALNGFYNAAQIPFLFYILILNFGNTGTVAYALIKNYIHLSNFYILLTPFCLLIFGVILRKIKHDWFYDLPGIIMPSLGTACIGLMGVLNIISN